MVSEPSALRVATLNLRHNADEWEKRAPLIVEDLVRTKPHLIALQEVWLPERQDLWLCEQLNQRLALTPREAFHATHRPKWGFDEHREGVSIIGRLPLVATSGVDLPGGRVAVSMDARWGRRVVRLVSVHLHFGPPDAADGIRRNQLRGMFAWLDELDPNEATMIGGDFNATPDSAAAVWMYQRGWRSAYATVHRHEPEWTYGTPLADRNNRARGAELFRGTLDYVFVPEPIRVRGAELFCADPSPDVPETYPSDHVGVLADLIIE